MPSNRGGRRRISDCRPSVGLPRGSSHCLRVEERPVAPGVPPTSISRRCEEADQKHSLRLSSPATSKAHIATSSTSRKGTLRRGLLHLIRIGKSTARPSAANMRKNEGNRTHLGRHYPGKPHPDLLIDPGTP